MTMAVSYPQISKWLSSWLRQLRKIGNDDDYRVIVDEISEIESGSNLQQYIRDLSRLDCHLETASTICRDFRSLIREKRRLPSEIDEANRTILDKLAEIGAIVGLFRLGFSDIEFKGTPDFVASFKDRQFLVEVTRLGASLGKRSDVWDYSAGSKSSVFVGCMDSGGKSHISLVDAIYRKVEDKCRQLKNSCQQTGGIIWISLGRDYLTAGRYELSDVGPRVRMPRDTKTALDKAVHQIRDTGLYPYLSHVVLSRGRDYDDLITPELDKNE